jgi:molybdenum cofactor biosynthesis enzyme MoaA
MAPDQLKNLVDAKFKVLCFVDLADCANDPTLAYKLFEKNYKSYYDPNEKFVFYTDSFIGQRTVDYFKHAAGLIDVSGSFILIFCSGTDQKLDEFDIDVVEINVKSRVFDESMLPDVNTICALPWMHLEVMNRGNVKACCFIQDSISQTKNFLNFDQLFLGPEMTQLRNNLFSGSKPDSCNECWQRESRGVESLRQWRIKQHAREFFMDRITAPKFTSLVLRPSTVCNFKCRSCNSAQSSQWAQEDLLYESDPLKKQALFQIISDTKWFDRDDTFSRLVLESIPKLEFLDIYGGEPLMTKQFKTLISESIRSNSAQNQKLHFNTNGSIFPENLISMMAAFKEVTISLSIDDIGERFEIIRGGSWSEVESNVDRFLSLPKDLFKISLLVTVSNLNVLYLDEIITWAKSKNVPATFQTLLHPNHLRFDLITQDLRDRLIDKFITDSEIYPAKIATELTKSNPSDVLEWKKQMKKLDLRRNQDLNSTHEELCQLMGYNE